jgi:hypothetical protein
MHKGLWWENFTDRIYLEDLEVDGRRISESILNTCDGIARTVFIGLRVEAGGMCSCEEDNERPCFLKGGEIFD